MNSNELHTNHTEPDVGSSQAQSGRTIMALEDACRSISSLLDRLNSSDEMLKTYQQQLNTQEKLLAQQQQSEESYQALMEENLKFAQLLVDREEELKEVYEIVSQLEKVYERVNGKYRTLSSYMQRLEDELHSINEFLGIGRKNKVLLIEEGGKQMTMDSIINQTDSAQVQTTQSEQAE